MIKKSILLVDDDQRLRELLKDYLNEKNFQVFTSEDFDEAKEILGFFIFDLIILDRMMPTGDGINLIKNIKKTSKTPIIMLTAMGENKLLLKLINNRNNTLSREELAEKEFDESELRKVDVGITRLRQKIEKKPKQPQYIKTIRGKGYMLICKEL